MKLKLVVLLCVFLFSLCSAQMKQIEITLKTGVVLKGIGKIKSDTFKYKADKNDEAQEFAFAEVKSAEFESDEDEKVVYRCFQTQENDEYIAVVEKAFGDKVELYTRTFVYNTVGMNGMQNFQQSTFYYVKKNSDEKLTALGEYNIIFNSLKSKVKDYFSDCSNLVDKLENRELKVRKGLEEIVEFYNKNCN